MSIKPRGGIHFTDKQERGRGRIAEIKSIINSAFVSVVESGWRGRGVERLAIPNFKIARVPHPNVEKGQEYADFPNYPVYVVCPADFPTVEYSYDRSHIRSRIVFDYSMSLEASKHVHEGRSTAFEPERKDSHMNNSAYGDFDGFKAPWYSNSDGSGSSGQGYVALVNRDGQIVTDTRTGVNPEYAVVFLGMAGIRRDKVAHYHGFAVVKK